jgi:hypothetical protein
MTCKRDVEEERLSLASELIKVPGLSPLRYTVIRLSTVGRDSFWI